jgi:phosphoserine phosphatase
VTTLFVQHGTSHERDRITELCQAYIKILERILPIETFERKILADSATLSVAEIVVQTTLSPDLVSLRRNAHIVAFANQNNVQLAFQKDHIYRRYKRLAMFDMDSTLIQQEVIDEIARKLGVEDKVATITARAMNGELDFTSSLRERVALLQGTPTSIFDELKDIITLSPGAAELVKVLKKLGYKTGVLSGGFKPLTPWLAQKLNLDHAHANTLVVSDDGKSLTGEICGDIVHAERKRDLVIEIARANNIPLDQVMVVGDGANDLPMMSVAGLGIAFNAKPRVQEAAPVSLNTSSLLDALYLLGISEKERIELLAESPTE